MTLTPTTLPHLSCEEALIWRGPIRSEVGLLSKSIYLVLSPLK